MTIHELGRRRRVLRRRKDSHVAAVLHKEKVMRTKNLAKNEFMNRDKKRDSSPECHASRREAWRICYEEAPPHVPLHV